MPQTDTRDLGNRCRPDDVDRAIGLAIDYLLANQRSDGSFVYRAHADGPVRVPHGYNILRHAGVLHAVSQALAAGRTDGAGIHALRTGVHYLADRLVGVPGGRGQVAVTTVAGIDGGNGEEAKLGAAGLGLVAMVAAERWCPGAVPRGVLRGIGDFIVHLQDAGGRFHSKYRIAEPAGPVAGWQSRYYPGQAALGLLDLADIEGDHRYRRAAHAALVHVAEERADARSARFDHWSLLAIGRALPDAVGLSDPDRRLLESYGRRLCRLVARRRRYRLAPHGALTVDRDVTSTASILEGVLAVRPVLDLAPFHQPLTDRIEAGVSFLVRSQLTEGPAVGGFPGQGPVEGLAVVEPTDSARPEIRIDHVQHALSALLRYRSLEHGSTRPFPIRSRTRPGPPPAPPIDVRPYADLLSPFRDRVGEGETAAQPVIENRDTGLFQLATDVADREDHVLYRARLLVLAPGPVTGDPIILDRQAWTCHRRLVLLSVDGRLRVAGDDSVVELRPGQVHGVDPIGAVAIDNRAAESAVVLEVCSRPRPARLRSAPFELVSAGIDVPPMAAELDAVMAGWTAGTRRRWLSPYHETQNLKLRTEWRALDEQDRPIGDQQRSHYSDVQHELPLIHRWLEDFYRNNRLDPGRARLVMLRPGGHALPHYDGGPYYRRRDRYLLVITGGSSTFTAGDATIQPQPGELWRFDNQLLHHATNHGTEPRIHLYFDARPWDRLDPEPLD